MNTDLEIALEFLDSPTEVDFFAVAGAPGHDGQDGAPGRDGADGHTPVITASKHGNTTTISVDGNTVAQILDGADGQPGQDGQDGSPGQDGADGHSPVVTASKSGKVTTVSVDGSPIATINDGEDGQDGQDGSDGQDGQDGHTPVKGTDYWTAADKAEIVEEAAGAVDIPAVASGTQVKDGSASSVFIAPGVEDAASFYGLAKAAGDSTQSASSNTVGTYTDTAKVAIQKMLGIYEPPWELINEGTFTNAESADYDITSDLNGQAFELTDAILMFEIPTQNNASAIGSTGQKSFYYGDGSNDCDVLYTGSANISVNSSPYYTISTITQEHGLVFVRSTNSNVRNNRTPENLVNTAPNLQSSSIKVISQKRYYNKIRILSILGTAKYTLYGRRKWQ